MNAMPSFAKRYRDKPPRRAVFIVSFGFEMDNPRIGLGEMDVVIVTSTYAETDLWSRILSLASILRAGNPGSGNAPCCSVSFGILTSGTGAELDQSESQVLIHRLTA